MVEVASDDSGENTGLDVGNEREGCRLARDGVSQSRLLSLLVGDEDGFSGLVIHHDTSRLIADKTLGRDLSPIDQRKHQSIGERGSKLLHEVESKRWTPGPIDVKVSHSRVETDSGECRGTVVTEEGVNKR